LLDSHHICGVGLFPRAYAWTFRARSPSQTNCALVIERFTLLSRFSFPILRRFYDDFRRKALYQEADELSAQGKVDESMQMYRKCVKMSPALAAIYGL